MFFHILYSPVKHIFYSWLNFTLFLEVGIHVRALHKTRETNFLKRKNTLIDIFAAYYYCLEIIDLPYRTLDTIANYYHIALNLISLVVRLHVKYCDRFTKKKWFHGKKLHFEILNIYILACGNLPKYVVTPNSLQLISRKIWVAEKFT